MGKRNKGEQKQDGVNTKKSKSDNDKNEISSTESTGNGQNKKIVFDDDKSTSIAPVMKITKGVNAIAPKRSQSEENGMENNKTKRNKKIIFTDDNEEGTLVTINKAQRTKNNTEEEPGDEEIDKFCDELDEEDNVQYDNWVKLIEAKLGPNKKK